MQHASAAVKKQTRTEINEDSIKPLNNPQEDEEEERRTRS